jgi:hypothetical protein
MCRLSSLLFIGLVTAILLASCSDSSHTAISGARTTSQLSSTATVSATSTPTSQPVATNTPHPISPSPTRTPAPTQTYCGLITATTTGTTTTTTPSDPTPLEKCFTDAWYHCQSTTLPANLALTFIDSTGTKAFALLTPPVQHALAKGECEVATGEETDFDPEGNPTGPWTFTCLDLVPSGSRFILKGCTNNDQIGFP